MVHRILFGLLLLAVTGCSSVPAGSPNTDLPQPGRETDDRPRRNRNEHDESAQRNIPSQKEEKPREEYDTGWSIYIDNDLISIGSQDDRYTGGVAVSLSGRRATDFFLSLDPILGYLNEFTGFSNLGGEQSLTRHSIEFGGTAFTPEDVEATEPLPDQQPYSSLIFLNNSRKTVNEEREVAYISTFSLGVLGLDAVGEVQNAIHNLTGSDEANGWDNQISDGGEPTAFYSLARQDLLAKQRFGDIDYDVRSLIGGSAGMVTQLGGGLDVRFGQISSSPWRFNPNYEEFINLGMPMSERERPVNEELKDRFAWASVQGRIRGYNAALEGQFRDSPVTFDRGELRTLVITAATGVTLEVRPGTRITVSLRGRTSEIRDDKEFFPMWGAIIFSRSY